MSTFVGKNMLLVSSFKFSSFALEENKNRKIIPVCFILVLFIHDNFIFLPEIERRKRYFFRVYKNYFCKFSIYMQIHSVHGF